MDPYPAGWLSLLPPIVAIVLAISTKEVFISLFVGILSGAFVHSQATAHDPVVATIGTACTVLAKGIDFEILLFCSMLGSLVYVIDMAGGTFAYGEWTKTRIKSRRRALLTTGSLGALIFIDDYFNCLTIGAIMKPVTDRYNISRAKLAYVIDATAAPICIIAPISSWAAAVGSSLKSTGAFESGMAAFVATIPWNFYALLSVLMIFVICFFNCDYGPMLAAERRAERGDLGINIVKERQKAPASDRSTVFDMLIPLLSLIVLAVGAMMYTGGYWSGDPSKHSFQVALGNAASSTSLLWASFGSLVVAFLLFVPRGLMTLKEFNKGIIEGVKLMLPACLILVLAWGISTVCRDLLDTPGFVRGLLLDAGFGAAVLPAGIFIVTAILSFSIGNSWATFAILIPIVVPTAQTMAPDLLIVCLSATLAGAVFGDHCSPLSDTTILSSAGACCNHVEHVTTQMGYAGTVAASCLLAYLVAGVTGGMLAPSLTVGTISLLVAIVILRRRDVARLPKDKV